MSFLTWTYLTLGLLGAVGGVISVRTSLNRTRSRAKGVDPGQGATLVTGGGGASHGAGGGYSSAITVPRDPQAYAKAMAPKK